MTIVIEHVPVVDLPPHWRARLAQGSAGMVTVRIEQEAPLLEPAAASPHGDDPLFGMWCDRQDMADVAGHVRNIRAARFTEEGPPIPG